MRKAASSDFAVTLPGVGDFVFARRTIGDNAKIDAERFRIAGPTLLAQYVARCQALGQDVDPMVDVLDKGFAINANLAGYASVVATLQVLLVSAPEGWENFENLSDDEFDKVVELRALLRAKEDSFRRPGPAPVPGEGAGEGAVRNDGVLVQGEVQPPAN